MDDWGYGWSDHMNTIFKNYKDKGLTCTVTTNKVSDWQSYHKKVHKMIIWQSN